MWFTKEDRITLVNLSASDETASVETHFFSDLETFAYMMRIRIEW